MIHVIGLAFVKEFQFQFCSTFSVSQVVRAGIPQMRVVQWIFTLACSILVTSVEGPLPSIRADTTCTIGEDLWLDFNIMHDIW